MTNRNRERNTVTPDFEKVVLIQILNPSFIEPQTILFEIIRVTLKGGKKFKALHAFSKTNRK